MKVKIHENVLKDIAKITKKYFPEEACSLLMGQKKENRIEIKESKEDENAERTDSFFQMDPQFVGNTLEEVWETELKHVGFFHSHPKKSAFVSERDRKFMELWSGKVWMVGGTDNKGKIREIREYMWSEGVSEIKIDRSTKIAFKSKVTPRE